ncbi:peroxiredoxin [Marimonas lutisalis]|uniref:peroxiredoxin n=1 Tax=Marimonas lutisalis TaxID=2545756 RepID=UPI0010F68620|nr:peroxiredoxin [Marimonas lutisalis]
MTISVGDDLPGGTLMTIGAEGPQPVELESKVQGRKVVIFAVPGAFTPTCHSAHVPSFLRVKDELGAKGVDEVICVSVNDPWVMQAWGDATGAAAGGITMLADATGAFTKAIGMDFDAPPVGFSGRSKRYAMLVDDGVVKVLNIEEASGTCEISGGEAMLSAL